MPIMDGPTATKKIRELGYLSEIFGLTGNTLDTDINCFLQCGANQIFAKPLDIDDFTRAMKEIVGKKGISQAKL